LSFTIEHKAREEKDLNSFFCKAVIELDEKKEGTIHD
jgi:hypothetical protein